MTGIRVLICHNYFTPYRAALFEALADRGLRVAVAYAHHPQDEGRSWRAPPASRVETYQSAGVRLGKLVLFGLPTRLARDCDLVILNDNNPTNPAMILWAIVLRLIGKRCLLWVEHVPDRQKGRSKTLYQCLCTGILSRLSQGVLAFSDMTRAYVAEVGVDRPRYGMIQAAPAPTFPPTIRSAGRLRCFGYLGSNAARKNVAALIAAFASLAGSDLRLHIAGHAGRHDDARIIWHGYVEGAAREAFFAQVDLLLLPSLADPWGLVLNEALMRDCLGAASIACGSVEMVRQIAPWLAFRPDPGGIVECLTTAVSLGPDEVSGLRDKARDIIARYTIDAAASALLAAVRDASA